MDAMKVNVARIL